MVRLRHILAVAAWAALSLPSTVEAADDVPALAPGDLLFVTARDSEFSKAIVDATGRDDVSESLLSGMLFDHVGIFDIDSVGSPVVIEATSRCGGVTVNPWREFADSAPCVLAISIAVPFDARASIDAARSRVGQPYDWDFEPDNGKCYCSELVEESYVSPDGKKIFSTRPMNFLAPDGTMPQFWTDLFDKSGKEIPQGQPGTNPNDMARDALAIGRIRLVLENVVE